MGLHTKNYAASNAPLFSVPTLDCNIFFLCGKYLMTYSVSLSLSLSLWAVLRYNKLVSMLNE